jgi:hypothetical protein
VTVRRITVRLSGGLGNQLFQYAAGRAAALRSGATLHLDHASFARDPLRRRFALGRFPIVAERRDLDGWRRRIVDVPGAWRIARRIGCAPRIGDTRFLFDRLRGFDGRIDDAAPRRVLVGYWQDERFFADAVDRLAAELDPSSLFPAATLRFGAELRVGIALGVHVRRADFAAVKSPHGTCSPEYYRDAVAAVLDSARVDRIVVFTDDPDWAKATLRFGRPFETIGRSPDRGDDEDLWLLGRCRHLVLANSSWSWWAARLAEFDRSRDPRGGASDDAEPSGTLVVCPSRWYRAAAGPIPHPAPSRWRRIDDPIAQP